VFATDLDSPLESPLSVVTKVLY